jgi:hypothetical protein
MKTPRPLGPSGVFCGHFSGASPEQRSDALSVLAVALETTIEIL